MPGISQIIFCSLQLSPDEIQGKRIIDVGSCDFNGSVRPLIEARKPGEYTGVDLFPGKGVDIVCSADDLVSTFGESRFDIVLSLEMLEHTPHWRRSLSNMKRVCTPGGLVIATTRSLGYPYHGHPNDYWRYEVEDFRKLFADFEILAIESDTLNPGVFIKARKPLNYQEASLADVRLYSMITGTRELEYNDSQRHSWHFKKRTTKHWLRRIGEELFFGSGRAITKLFKL